MHSSIKSNTNIKAHASVDMNVYIYAYKDVIMHKYAVRLCYGCVVQLVFFSISWELAIIISRPQIGL